MRLLPLPAPLLVPVLAPVTPNNALAHGNLVKVKSPPKGGIGDGIIVPQDLDFDTLLPDLLFTSDVNREDDTHPLLSPAEMSLALAPIHPIPVPPASAGILINGGVTAPHPHSHSHPHPHSHSLSHSHFKIPHRYEGDVTPGSSPGSSWGAGFKAGMHASMSMAAHLVDAAASGGAGIPVARTPLSRGGMGMAMAMPGVGEVGEVAGCAEEQFDTWCQQAYTGFQPDAPGRHHPAAAMCQEDRCAVIGLCGIRIW